MKATLLTLVICTLTIQLFSQTVKKINIPNIPGYVTLKGDFHIHTVFSDGEVWPTVRVDEAVREGLDVIAITDHIEYRPHLSDVPSDHNRSFDIAKPHADKKNIILIKASEITRSMPPGHFNALFISDAAALAKDDFKAAVIEAKKQGGFIIWNHPGWKAQQPDTTKWFDIHTWLFDNGMLNGIEIYNEKEFYPIVFNWALNKNITIFANTDTHTPTSMMYDLANSHRPITLVFAKERTEAHVREALFNGNTASFTENTVRGKEEWLKPLFYACVKQEKNNKAITLTNLSGITLELEYMIGKKTLSITLTEGSTVTLNSGTIIKVMNFEIAPSKKLEVKI
jgi:hypothetical protein